jgi:hypothetical protein
MISMEARGVVGNTFHAPFRRRKPWTVDWSQEPGPAGDTPVTDGVRETD